MIRKIGRKTTSIKVSVAVTVVVAFLMITTAFTVVNAQTNGAASNNRAIALLGASTISDNLAGLNKMSKGSHVLFNISAAYGTVIGTANELLSRSDFNAYQSSLGQRASFQWGLTDNYSNSNLSLYFQLTTNTTNSTTVYTWGADNNWVMETPNVSYTQNVPVYGFSQLNKSYAGYYFINQTNQSPGFEPVQEIQATVPVAGAESPPSDQMTQNFMGAAAWIGLQPDTLKPPAQTGWERLYKNNDEIGTYYWHHYHIWYALYPSLGRTWYPGSPDLTTDWYIDFSVGYDNPGFTFTAYIENTGVGYVASTSISFIPDFAYATVEAPNYKYPTNNTLWVSQIAEFSEVDFYLGLVQSNGQYFSFYQLYTNGWYAQDTLQQNPNEVNTQEGFSSSSSYGYYPYVTWQDSYYSWSYVNG